MNRGVASALTRCATSRRRWRRRSTARSTVSRICASTRERYRAWCGRRLDEHDLVYLFLDPVNLKLRPEDTPAEVIERDLDALVRHLRFPPEHRKRTRSTNLLERTFVEVRRRTKVIGRFAGETSALSLVWAVLELSSRGWRGVLMTPRAVAEIERLRRSATTDKSEHSTEEMIAA